MVGRTHGQPGAPITFGFKVASWADEVRRHLDRLRESAPLGWSASSAVAVGVLGFFGPAASGCGRSSAPSSGLADPGISWLTFARSDR